MKQGKLFTILLVATFALSIGTQAQKNTKPGKRPATVAKPDTLTVLTNRANAGDAAAQNTLGTWYYNGKNVKQDYAEALKWWLKAAKQDHAEAIGNVGLCYQLGKGAEPDSTLAVNLYKKSITKGNKALLKQHEQLAEKSSLFSNALLYDLYTNGVGVKKSPEKAVQYLKKVVDGGDVSRRYQLALDLLNLQKPDKALPYFKAEAAKGNPTAIYYYGYLLHAGMGVTQNKERGIQLMTQAEEKGVTAADYQLGRIYFEGDGTPVNHQRAVDYLKKAAPTNGKAQWLLAQCYIDGKGTDTDYALAAQWMAEPVQAQKEKLRGWMNDNSQSTFMKYLKGLRLLQFENNPVAALPLFKEVEKAGNIEGTVMQAVCLNHTNNPKRNIKKAVKLLEKTKDSSATACLLLARCYEKGEGVKQDVKQAVSLLQKAAGKGNAEAQCLLGTRYFNGQGVTQDFTQAARLFLQAEAQRHLTPEAAKLLAQCYQKRIGILPDLNKAKQRIEQLNKVQNNDRLFSLLKLVE